MNIGNTSKNQQVFQLLQKSLDAASTRSEVIENNIANVNTKNYKKRYVSFEDTLKKSVDAIELKTDNSRHIKTKGEYGEIEVKQDNTSSMREDGNNVDVEIEEANQAANYLMYNALISQTNSRISQKRYVISGK